MSRVLLIPDVPGWAWDRRAMALRKYAPAGVEASIMYDNDVHPSWGGWLNHDAVLHFNWTNSRDTGHKNYWGFVANEGCMYPWPAKDKERLRYRTSSKSKNRRTAIERMKRFTGGMITVNPSETLREFLAMASGAPVRYLRTGVDTELFHETEEARPKADVLRVGWCGKPSVGDRFTPKGFAEVLQPLIQQMMDARVEWRINARDHEKRYDAIQMVAWYNSLDVLLVTSSVEGTPSVLLEAMACGVPVISTPVGITHEVASCECQEEPKGLYKIRGYNTAAEASGTVGAIRSILKALIDHAELNRAMGEQARRTVESHFAWRDLAAEWFNVLLHKE